MAAPLSPASWALVAIAVAIVLVVLGAIAWAWVTAEQRLRAYMPDADAPDTHAQLPQPEDARMGAAVDKVLAADRRTRPPRLHERLRWHWPRPSYWRMP